MRVLTKKDSVSIVFGEWFDKTYGNTYYDAYVRINDKSFELPSQYGYNHGDKQAIDEALADCGYRVRGGRYMWKAYDRIHSVCKDKKYRELYN